MKVSILFTKLTEKFLILLDETSKWYKIGFNMDYFFLIRPVIGPMKSFYLFLYKSFLIYRSQGVLRAYQK